MKSRGSKLDGKTDRYWVKTAGKSTDGLCMIVPLPNGTNFGIEERRTGAWSKWKSRGPYVQGPEEHRGKGAFWSAYYCDCVRSRSLDWHYYLQPRTRMVQVCLTCGVPSIREWDELGSKTYYRKQSLDVERKTVPGGVTIQSEAWMETDCEEKCNALNNK